VSTLAPMSAEPGAHDPVTMGQPLPVPRPGYQVVGVALPVPQPHGDFLQRKRADFNDPMAWAIPAHVTILGPTELRPTDLGEFEAHLRDVAKAFDPFRMVLRGTGTFRPVSNVVFVQLAHGQEHCASLETATRSGPWHRELEFPYHPHVTVAHDVRPADLDRAETELADYNVAFDVADLWLFELGADGQWRPRQSFPFAHPRARHTAGSTT
jgi:2'-5' RNA ligase